MKILLVYNHYAVSSGKYCKEALQRMGHDVRSAGPEYGTAIWGTHVSGDHIDRGSFIIGGGWEPELVIITDSDSALLHVKLLRQRLGLGEDIPFVVYGVDNHVRNYNLPWHADSEVAHYFLAHKWPSKVDMDAENVTWLPCGYDSSFVPSPIPWPERKWDVLLCGVLYPQRATILNRLAAAGLKVHHALGAIGGDYVRLHHDARIALNVSANYDLSQRIFETAALGCGVLTDRIPDMWEVIGAGRIGTETDIAGNLSGHTPAYPIWEVAAPDRFVSVARHMLGSPPEASAQTWLRPHTWEARLGTLIACWGEAYGE